MTASFPLRCIFTNEPVEEYSRIKLAKVHPVGVAPLLFVVKDERFISLPLSDTWRRRKLQRWFFLASTLKLIGLVLLLGGLLTPWIIELDINKTIAFSVLGTMFGGTIFLVGILIPYLEDTVDVNSIHNIVFFKCGLIGIPFASKDFLASLPVATIGWYHGFFWCESIRLPKSID